MIDRSAHVPKVCFVTRLQRTVVRQVSEMPLTDECRFVARGFDERCDSRMFERDTSRLQLLFRKLTSFPDRFFKTDWKSCRISTGEKSYTRRRANRCRRV